ncbi:MAG: hypothetical protein HDT28_08235 [Clostridiales bacterium]|nr:hypothetical protein [Clostridiales bacterium]
MDKSIIWDLVFSGSCYADKIKLGENKTYKKCSSEFEQKLEKLCEGMTEEEKYKLMWDITMLQGSLESEASQEYFKEGFKLGMMIAAQCFLY